MTRQLTRLHAVLLLGLLPLLAACAAPAPKPQPVAAAAVRMVQETSQDPHSFAQPDEVAVEHLKLDLTVDFPQKKLTGRASLRIKNKTGADRLILDTRDLDVRRVTLDSGQATRFTLRDPVPLLGRALEIEITPQTQWVNVDYSTRPEAAALQWLEPAQTAAKTTPFLLTQSESILARTWVPCQDTPGVRMTYEATIRVPRGLLALMSAENPTEDSADGVYHFKMEQPIPSYLLALAVGELEFRPLGQRSGVYAEPGVIDLAAWELADTPKMIEAAERLYGPYRWGRYDMIILPPSFPYGGMENPRLTFTTPTILARDRSLVSLIAHELAHSWSGNLVTNATWNDFWLNEGFTTYFERRIMEALYGKEYTDMLAVLGRQDLQAAIDELGADSPDTHLFLNLAGRDPDEATGDVAYEKGALFLRTIEEAVGRQRFDPFLRSWFESHAFQSMDTARFVAYLQDNLLKDQPGLAEKLQIEKWIYGPGVPSNEAKIRSTALAQVDQQVKAFAQGAPAAQLQTPNWTTHHWLHFIRNLPEPLGADKLADLDAAFRFTQSGNSEILNAWLLRAIRGNYEPANPALEHFLAGMGRRKFLKPLFTELAKTPAGAELALRIYEQARPGYHPLSQQMVDEILGWRE
ncbi:MAG TPA: M1 family metallopeptidase [Thermoanaerobaculia bacterium]|nr:M1 family metallopeptidase [Thermoanaerobaculia bacterium]